MKGSLLIFLAMLVAGCATQASLPHPLDGQRRYLCCNLHYEGPKVADVNYQQGALIPLGTPVTITEVRRNTVTFQPQGHQPITAVLKHGRKAIDVDTFANRLLVEHDPKPKLARMNAKVRQNVQSGVVEPGMTREQVLMALGYPPAHRTPSLESPQWTYWQNRWVSFVVWFEGDRVSRTDSLAPSRRTEAR
jgi:hypothetical protein